MSDLKSFLHQKSVFVAAVFMIAAGAFVFRIPLLDQRPLHTDESVHCIKAMELFENGIYQYDPSDYHGPTIYFFAFPFLKLAGVSKLADTQEWMFRIVPVLFGTGLVLLLLTLSETLGRGPIVVAALLTALSPAFVFYSRYYIQEIELVFFTVSMLAFLLRYAQTCRIGWLFAAGLCAGFMQATKETSVIAWAAMTLSFGLVYLWAYRSGEATPLPSFRILVWGIVGAVGIAVFTAFLLLTNFFHNPHAMFDAVATYFSYVHRSNGATPHDHPWWYYLRLLAFASGGPRIWWSEGVILFLACVGFLAAFFDGIGVGNRWYWRFIAVYTVVLVVIYSAIPYKTPWCMLTFLNGMILLAGAGFGAIQRFFRYRILQYMVVVLFAACLVQLGQQAYRAAYRFCADPRNPYVYAHTSTNFMKLVQRIEQIAAVDPAGHDLFIQVITPDAWPLPWYLRGYSHVGYWAQPPDGPIQAPMVIVSAEMAADVEKRLAGDYLSDMYGLRPEVLITLHIRKDLWNVFLKSKSVMEQNIFLSHFCFYAQRG